MQPLSPEQQDIVDTWLAPDTEAMLVSASAGSGKTRLLTECVRRILTDAPKERFRVLCLTFTNKAAEEMSHRLSDIKGIKERAFINTIHAFGLDVISAYRQQLGYDDMPHIIERDTDRKEILKEVFLQNPSLEKVFRQIPEDKKEQFERKSDPLAEYQIDILDQTLQWISLQKRRLTYLDNETYEYKNWKNEHILVFKLYNQHLREQNLIEFDDILLLAWRILSIPRIASIYHRLYRYVLVDEAQDLNYGQYELIKTLCGNSIKHILLVGDGNQAIHGYTGADKKYMFEEFKRDFHAVEKKIEKNYRSSIAVLQLAKQIVQSSNGETVSNNQFYKGHAEIRHFPNEAEEAAWIIATIQSLLVTPPPDFDFPVELSNIAVLGRTKFVFKELERQLSENANLSGSYFLKRGAESLEPDSTLIKTFDLGTRILENPQGEVYWNQLTGLLQISAERSRGLGMEMLRTLCNHLPSEGIIQPEVFNLLLEVWQKIDINTSQMEYVLKYIQESLHILNDEEERRNAGWDIQEWQDMWRIYLKNTPAGKTNLADFRRFIAMGYNKPNTKEGLTLATIHTVKGLEFDIVFLMGMNEGVFPDYRALRMNGKAINEERNNAYVAVTRAKRNVYVTYPLSRIMPWGISKNQEVSSFIKNSSFLLTEI